MSECGKCGHAHVFVDVCGATRPPVQPATSPVEVCECRGRSLWELFAEDEAERRSELWGTVRAALGYEYGRQVGAGYSEPDVDGLANAVVAALES